MKRFMLEVALGSAATIGAIHFLKSKEAKKMMNKIVKKFE